MSRVSIRQISFEKDGVLATVFIPRRAAGRGSALEREILGAIGLDGGLRAPKAAGSARVAGATRGRAAVPKSSLVLEAVAGGASTPQAITQATGLPNRTVHAYISYLKKNGKIERTGAGAYQVPD